MKTPAFWYKPPGLLSTLLAPLSLLYAAGRWLDETIHFTHYFAQPVICIGNAVAGGAGKTPTTLALVDLLQAEGVVPHIVTRGYGGIECGPRRVKPDDTATQVGDETLLLAAAAPTWVAQDRKLGIGCALSASAPLVLLDDGLQNTKVRALLNFLVVDGASGFGNGQLLPAGPLREFPTLLRRRVQALVMIGEDKHKIAAYFPSCPVFGASVQPDLDNLDINQPYAAFAGLARPEKFFKTGVEAGLQIVDEKSFADHHPYSEADRKDLMEWAAKNNAQLLTTTKDAQRWPPSERHVLKVLPIQLIFDRPQQVRQYIKDKLNV